MDPTKTKTPVRRHQGFLAIEFSDIDEPGVYVTQRGEMFRLPPEALSENHSPVLTWDSLEGSIVTRISEDPYAPISKCRQLAADADLAVNF